MSNSLVTKVFEGSEVRVHVDQAGQPWFNAADVCSILEFGNSRQAIESHVDSEDVQKLDTLTAGGRQLQNHINESGLYALIFGSTKDAAKRFKRWVTSEVLPAIRTTGEYVNEEIKQKLRAEQEKVAYLDRENFDMKMLIRAGGADYGTFRKLQSKIFFGIASSRGSGITTDDVLALAKEAGNTEAEALDVISDMYNMFKVIQGESGEWLLARKK